MLSCSLITTMARFDPEPGYPTRPLSSGEGDSNYDTLLGIMFFAMLHPHTLLGGVTFYPNGKSQTDTLTPHCRGALVPRGIVTCAPTQTPTGRPKPIMGIWQVGGACRNDSPRPKGKSHPGFRHHEGRS